MSERNPWFEPPVRPTPREAEAAGGAASPWRLWPLGRNRWLLLRAGDPIAELGVLGTTEWWVCPIGEALPWAETYGCRSAASRAVIVWWLHTHPFGEEA
ncbi:hypothetical protein [Cryptosporangium sp. NPDC048952]|uniref:hypothetical protein n=1 Tax=Cryptosporangium sp. NPDC048952 TaxID=3363961 RepID=UPI00370F7F26